MHDLSCHVEEGGVAINLVLTWALFTGLDWHV